MIIAAGPSLPASHVPLVSRTTQHFSSMAHEELEKGELLGRQIDRPSRAPHPAVCRVQDQVTNLHNGRTLNEAAPGQRAYARQQLDEGERLGEIIVGSRIEPQHTVLNGITSSEHQYWSPLPCFAQFSAHFEAVEVGEHDV